MRMTRNQLLYVTSALIISVSVLTYIYHCYYNKNIWPADIQTHLFGRQIVNRESLVAQEGFSHYGQGMFRWTYNIKMTNSEIKILCGNQDITECNFSREKKLNDDVILTSRFSNDTLILEEIWL